MRFSTRKCNFDSFSEAFFFFLFFYYRFVPMMGVAWRNNCLVFACCVASNISRPIEFLNTAFKSSIHRFLGQPFALVPLIVVKVMFKVSDQRSWQNLETMVHEFDPELWPLNLAGKSRNADKVLAVEYRTQPNWVTDQYHTDGEITSCRGQ